MTYTVEIEEYRRIRFGQIELVRKHWRRKPLPKKG